MAFDTLIFPLQLNSSRFTLNKIPFTFFRVIYIVFFGIFASQITE